MTEVQILLVGFFLLLSVMKMLCKLTKLGHSIVTDNEIGVTNVCTYTCVFLICLYDVYIATCRYVPLNMYNSVKMFAHLCMHMNNSLGHMNL